MEEFFRMLGMLIVLLCLMLPLVIIALPFVIAAIIGVGAIVPMYVAFGIGYAVKATYQLFTYKPPRRALVE